MYPMFLDTLLQTQIQPVQQPCTHSAVQRLQRGLDVTAVHAACHLPGGELLLGMDSCATAVPPGRLLGISA